MVRAAALVGAVGGVGFQAVDDYLSGDFGERTWQENLQTYGIAALEGATVGAVAATAGLVAPAVGLGAGATAVAVGGTTGIGTGLATTTYAYDNNGNLTSVGAKLFSWNYRDRLTQVATGTATTTYGYDHNNQRTRMTVLGVGTTTFAGKWFDKFVSTTGATSTSYIFANDVLIATVEGNGNSTSTKFIHGDHLGGTNVVTNASGTVVQVLDYYPYGASRINNSTGGADVKRKYDGMERDNSTGLDYALARYYDNTRGQFLSEDPVFWELGLNGETGTGTVN